MLKTTLSTGRRPCSTGFCSRTVVPGRAAGPGRCSTQPQRPAPPPPPRGRSAGQGSLAQGAVASLRGALRSAWRTAFLRPSFLLWPAEETAPVLQGAQCAQVETRVCCAVQHTAASELWFPQGVGPAVGLLRHMVVLFLVFKEISILFSIVAVSVYIPTNFARGGSLFSIPSPAFFFYRFFFVFWLMLAILTGVS